MLRIFISHSTKDKPFVRELTQFLRDDTDLSVWIDENEIQPGDNIVTKITEGLEAEIVLFVMSPDSVTSNWVREEWTDAYWEQVNTGKVKLIGVLLSDCTIPRLIRNKKYFDLRTNQPQGFREIKAWLLKIAPPTPPPPSLPERPEVFIGREAQILDLRTRLAEPGRVVVIPGQPGLGKTMLAREFAHRHYRDFETVYWLACERGDLAALVGDLAMQIGLEFPGDPETALREIKTYCARKRCLLVLDNVDGDGPERLIPGGRASVLITTRREHLNSLGYRDPVPLELFTEGECFHLFRQVLGNQVDREQANARTLFAQLGYLPIAISVAAALVKYDVRFTIERLVKKFPPLEELHFGLDNVGDLLKGAIASCGNREQALLRAMAACAPEGFGFELATEVAGLEEAPGLEALNDLKLRSLVEELDRNARRYRLHALMRRAAEPEEPLRLRHAQAVERRFEAWETNWRECGQDLADLRRALEWALEASEDAERWRLAGELAYGGFSLARRIGRPLEAYEFSERRAAACATKGDKEGLQAWYGNQALILQAWGRLKEALALHKKQEAICEELGNRDGLQIGYGNQALILQDWGRLEEALALHKKQEAICEELGNRDSLQRSYGNQALILKAWGRLEEALALHKQEEAICEELGNRDGLQMSYGNQAGILHAWGRPEEALALHKQEEAICEELGNRDGLQRSYGNEALILKAWGRLEEALALHKKEEAICEELGNRDGLQKSYGNQAGILQEWGRLGEALALHKQEEAICEELGNRDGLQRSYGNQALILKAWGRLEEALALLKKQETICEELGNRDGLQISYGNQAGILQAWERLEEALALYKKQEAICEELGNRDSLRACYGNQGLILQDWGRLEEALALHKKQEAICIELGSPRATAYCNWQLANLAERRGDLPEARERGRVAAGIFRALNMPRELGAVEELLAELGDEPSAAG